MTRRELISHCAAAIGDPDQDDWKIAPTEHAAALEKSAPALSAVLREPRVKLRAEEYERADAIAGEEQRNFKSLARRAGWCVFGVVVLGAALMGAGTLSPGEETGRVLSITLGALALLCGGFATAFLNQLSSAKCLQRWYGSRARAEQHRLDYFGEVVAPREGDDHAALNLLKLEYLRRFLLESQKRYFGKRSREHLAGFRRSGGAIATASLVASFFLGISGLLGGIDPRWMALGALGVIATGVISLQGVLEGVEQNQRNAEQYERTRELLVELSFYRYGEVQNMLACGATEGARELAAFYRAVREVLMEDHALWLEGQADRARVLDDLENELRRLNSPREGEGRGPGAEGWGEDHPLDGVVGEEHPLVEDDRVIDVPGWGGSVASGESPTGRNG